MKMSHQETKISTSMQFNVKRKSNASQHQNHISGQNTDKPRKTSNIVIKKISATKLSISNSTQRFLSFSNRLNDFHLELKVILFQLYLLKFFFLINYNGIIFKLHETRKKAFLDIEKELDYKGKKIIDQGRLFNISFDKNYNVVSAAMAEDEDTEYSDASVI